MKKLALLSLVLVLASCAMHKKGEDGKDGTAGKSGMSNNHYKILTDGGYGSRETASQEVIDSKEGLDRLYEELNLGNAPQVDFDAYNVVALFMGQKSSGGYSIGISSVKFEGNTAAVKIKTTTPKPGENVTMALTQPYCIATVTKTDKVTFE